jgi:hypothetical protein
MATAGNPVAAQLIHLLAGRFTTASNWVLMQVAYQKMLEGRAECRPLSAAKSTSRANLAEG